jgi:dolichol-phosphate mannosyltransferase
MIFVILPAFNEEGSILTLIERIKIFLSKEGIQYRIIAVDDGSTDRTFMVLQSSSEENLTILRHGKNLGLGAALQTGIKEALEKGDDDAIIVTMDADDTQSPDAISEMVKKIRYEGFDIVIGSRFRKGSIVQGVPGTRRILSLGASLLFRLLRQVPGVRDYTSGYRAYKVKALRIAIDKFGERMFQERGFSCMVDILLKCASCGMRVTEVAMELKYYRKAGRSKMKIARTTLKTISILFSRGR